jgi:uncharacterized protein
MIAVILILGFLFGTILQYAKLNRYNVISGMATLENLAVAKAIAVAIGVGAVILAFETGMGFASFHIKPLIVGGIVLGGILFGVGMAILGYCPGTLLVSLGEGSIDALMGITGGLFGGLMYTIALPFIQPYLGPDIGSFTLYSLVGQRPVIFYILSIIAGVGFVWAGFLINRKEKTTDLKWLYAGIALAMLNAIVFLSTVADRQIGASTAYPYIADLIAGTTQNNYFSKIQGPGHWELLF